MRKILAVALPLLSGCANVTPYAEAFIGYRVNQNGFDSCSNENAGIRLGLERAITESISVSGMYEHTSHLLCGSPFNDEIDPNYDHVGVSIRYEFGRK